MSTFTLSRPLVAVSGLGPLKTLIAISATYQQRLKLSQLEAHRLADMGISSADAAFEAARPVWDVPTHWKK